MYDIIITGAGLVGTTLALALEQAGFNIALIDAKPRLTTQYANDLRTVALSHTSVRWLQKTGVWNALPEEAKSSYQKMCIFEHHGPKLHFNANEANLPSLGYMVSHDQLLLAAQSLLKNDVFFSTCVENLSQDADQIVLSFDNQQQIKAKILLGCDGADSFLRKALGMTQQTRPYHQHALVAVLQCERWHQHTAWQCFSKDAVMGLLPLHDRHQVNMVWSLNSDLAKQYVTLSKEMLEQHIQSMFGDDLGKLTIVSAHVATFPLVARHSHEYGAGRVILLGDAIHTVHPLAGQGVNLGFLDAAAMVECLVDVHHPPLSRFERRRKAHNFLMMHLMTVLKAYYASEKGAWMRHAGVRLLDRSGWVKKMLIGCVS